MSHYGFDFRATSGFVADAAGNSPVLGESYPNVYSNGLTAGYELGGDVITRDRDNTYDARLAGTNYCSNGGVQQSFRIDLPVSGLYTISLASGDISYSSTEYISIYDNSSLLSILLNGAVAGLNSFYDAAGNNYYPGPNWVAGQQAVNLTFSTTIARIYIGNASGSSTINFIGLDTSYAPWTAVTSKDFSKFPIKQIRDKTKIIWNPYK